MSAPDTLTIPVSVAVKDGLRKLALRTHRDFGKLAAEAITDYVSRELATVEAIERARAEVRSGDVTPHEEVMRLARSAIEAARRRP